KKSRPPKFCSRDCLNKARGTLHHHKIDVAIRFWSKVNKIDGCWLGTAAVAGKGDYGYFGFQGKIQRAHRVSWILTFGEIPDGLFVLHKCDTPLCVRPDHLFLGTQQDNVDDMARK